MTVVIIIVSLLLAVAFLATGLPKVTGKDAARRQAEHLGVPFGGYRAIGWLETAAAVALVVGLWWEWLAVVASIGLVLLMIGAVVAHRRAGDPTKAATPSIALGLLALLNLVLLIAR
ncbi:DoxX-like protein [Stackebrandtia albiflava]|uniref:DoxX-like protein n=1 Tax=Stackebrandtia albiflava TaxID=406432 RepID=A0A562V0U3_9ACTN|nr:DoxX family protein [Stackebrandtia albiflava]TWJ11540.1 DoxX-like protein [Stackebrandtia albiflava]